MIVVDASVLADALCDDGAVGDRVRRELSEDDHWAAPSYVLVEVLSVVRGRLLGGKINAQRAEDAVEALAEIVVDKVEVDPLLARMWQLRDNVSSYDAAYVAAAEFLGCALVTADTRLSKAPGLRCRVIVV